MSCIRPDQAISNCGNFCAGEGPGGDSVVEFTPSQLATGGSVSPQVTISGPAIPDDLAFDGDGVGDVNQVLEDTGET